MDIHEKAELARSLGYDFVDTNTPEIQQGYDKAINALPQTLQDAGYTQFLAQAKQQGLPLRKMELSERLDRCAERLCAIAEPEERFKQFKIDAAALIQSSIGELQQIRRDKARVEAASRDPQYGKAFSEEMKMLAEREKALSEELRNVKANFANLDQVIDKKLLSELILEPNRDAYMSRLQTLNPTLRQTPEGKAKSVETLGQCFEAIRQDVAKNKKVALAIGAATGAFVGGVAGMSAAGIGAAPGAMVGAALGAGAAYGTLVVGTAIKHLGILAKNTALKLLGKGKDKVIEKAAQVETWNAGRKYAKEQERGTELQEAKASVEQHENSIRQLEEKKKSKEKEMKHLMSLVNNQEKEGPRLEAMEVSRDSLQQEIIKNRGRVSEMNDEILNMKTGIEQLKGLLKEAASNYERLKEEAKKRGKELHRAEKDQKRKAPEPKLPNVDKLMAQVVRGSSAKSSDSPGYTPPTYYDPGKSLGR